LNRMKTSLHSCGQCVLRVTMKTIRIFLAGIIQGSSKDRAIHPQDYRERIKAILQENCPEWDIIDPLEIHPDSVSYDEQTSTETLLELVRLAAECDIVVAYTPEASMGVALEMWECKRAGVPVVCITTMSRNWVVQATSSVILASLDEFESSAANGDLQKLVESRPTRPGSVSIVPEPGKIYEGDCIEVMSGWNDDVFDACITDPPYNMSKKKGLAWAFSSHVTMTEKWDMFSSDEYAKFCRQWIQEVMRVVKPNGNVYIFGSYHNIFLIGAILQEMDVKIINSIVWFKPNAQPNITCRQFTESTEYVIWACNNSSSDATKWTFNYDRMKELNKGKQMRNVWDIPVTPPREKRHGKHPAQKAEQVLERIVLAGTNEGDLILDCFAGAGSTAVVAERLARRWVLIEKERKFNQIAKKRLEEVRKPT